MEVKDWIPLEVLSVSLRCPAHKSVYIMQSKIDRFQLEPLVSFVCDDKNFDETSTARKRSKKGKNIVKF